MKKTVRTFPESIVGRRPLSDQQGGPPIRAIPWNALRPSIYYLTSAILAGPLIIACVSALFVGAVFTSLLDKWTASAPVIKMVGEPL
jgi:hypothetical protein